MRAHVVPIHVRERCCRVPCRRFLAARTPRIGGIEPGRQHAPASLPHVDGHYMGAHWLASFAVLAIDGN
jgi:hypothetical protein